ncbi:hypothetical protein A9Q99_12650 [Gammaproteobacteria bacterium 45_16_T64]|nr:hypothetical protein A9Q99_12650 [Gammaproteobacteria bacterium 45_16_T64]
MQLFAILAVLVAANFGAVYYGSDMLDDQSADEPTGIVEIQEEVATEIIDNSTVEITETTPAE